MFMWKDTLRDLTSGYSFTINCKKNS